MLRITSEYVTARMPKLFVHKRKKQLIDKEILTGCLRVGRCYGPYGHAGGRSFREFRNQVTSQIVRQAMPRTEMGSIVVPYYARGQPTLVSELVPYYVGVKNTQMKVVKPRFNAIPRLGWIVDNTDILKLMKEQDIPIT
jgi:hypothetical protein